MPLLEIEKKILLIGEASVGKTSLIRRFVIDKFDDKYIVTIGTKVSRKVLDFSYPQDKTNVALMLGIWDIIGQQDSERTHTMHFKGAEAFILVLDGTRRETFDAVDAWAERARSLCGPIPGVLACNKADLRPQFKVSEVEVSAKARALGLDPIITSAKTGDNVEEAFRRLGDGLCRPVVATSRLRERRA